MNWIELNINLICVLLFVISFFIWSILGMLGSLMYLRYLLKNSLCFRVSLNRVKWHCALMEFLGPFGFLWGLWYKFNRSIEMPSKLGWKIVPTQCFVDKYNIIQYVDDGYIVIGYGLTKTNAEHIVKCCNYHEDLMDACKNVLDGNIDKDSLRRLINEIGE